MCGPRYGAASRRRFGIRPARPLRRRWRQAGQCGPNAPGGDSKPIYYNILHNIRPGSAGIGRARPIRRRTVFCSSVLIFLCDPETPGDSGSIDSDQTGSASVGPPTPRSERLSLRRRARTASQPGAALSLCGVTQRRLRGIRPAQRRADGSVLSASMPYTRLYTPRLHYLILR